MNSLSNRQTIGRIGVRRCSTSPDIITGFEERRRLLSRYEYSRNERNDRERQENIRDYQRVRGAAVQRDPTRTRRPRYNPPLFHVSPNRRDHQGRSKAEPRDGPVNRSRHHHRRIVDPPDFLQRLAMSLAWHDDNDGTAPPSGPTHSHIVFEQLLLPLKLAAGDSPPKEVAAREVNEESEREILVAKRSKGEGTDSDAAGGNEASTSQNVKSSSSESKSHKRSASGTPVDIDSTTQADSAKNSSMDSDDSSSSDERSSKKRAKKAKKEKKKSKKAKKKGSKVRKMSKKDKKKAKKAKAETRISKSRNRSSKRDAANNGTDKREGYGESQNVGTSGDMHNLRSRMAPMTKEQWEKEQSQIRREVSPNTGRSRLIKGTGEILEEIVSRDRQKAINRMATIGDGQAFQASLQAKLNKK